MALYELGNSIFARFDETIFCLTDDTVARIDPGDSRNRFTLLRGEETLIEIDYYPRILDPPLSLDPTPFVEEEHFDIFLFINNCVNDKARLARMHR